MALQHSLHHNFASIYKNLRITPAMAAGISDHIWSMKTIAMLTVAAYAPKKRGPLSETSRMRLLKSVGVGILFVFTASAFILLSGFAFLVLVSSFSMKTSSVGWDPVSLMRPSMYEWMIVLSSFAIGFIWEYRRLLRR